MTIALAVVDKMVTILRTGLFRNIAAGELDRSAVAGGYTTAGTDLVLHNPHYKAMNRYLPTREIVLSTATTSARNPRPELQVQPFLSAGFCAFGTIAACVPRPLHVEKRSNLYEYTSTGSFDSARIVRSCRHPPLALYLRHSRLSV